MNQSVSKTRRNRGGKPQWQQPVGEDTARCHCSECVDCFIHRIQTESP